MQTKMIVQLEPGDFANLDGLGTVMIQESRQATEKERGDNWFILDDCYECQKLTWLLTYSRGTSEHTWIFDPHDTVEI